LLCFLVLTQLSCGFILFFLVPSFISVVRSCWLLFFLRFHALYVGIGWHVRDRFPGPKFRASLEDGES
jgi:hypothetical protein